MMGKLVLSLLAIALLAPWPVAYAYDAGAAGLEPVHITAAGPDAAPGWKAFGGAVGSVNPGDLFYIDGRDDSLVDRLVILHLTNADELVHYYRNIVLDIGVYVLTDSGKWEKTNTGNAEMGQDRYLTMRTGYVSFILPGNAEYKITIDGGCFYCFTAPDTGDISPKFYLTVE
ncbi:hypothetical protein ACFLXF_00040 [Chloroflexota bacterium]